jgi:hypothetical protein
MPHPIRRLCKLLPFAAASVLPATASESAAVTFQAEFASTTYQVVLGDSYSDLLAEHLAGTPLASVSMLGFENVSAPISAGVSQDYSILLSVDLEIATAGQYVFQVGTDWGRGGVAAILDGSNTVIDELVRTDDIWWGNDWGNPDVFTTTVNLDAGSPYTLVWLGFEDCCAGGATIRFSYEGGAFQNVNETNLAPFTVPEPRTGLLAALGLAILAGRRRSPRA